MRGSNAEDGDFAQVDQAMRVWLSKTEDKKKVKASHESEERNA